jgi:geranylgeranyl reductase family protein
MAPQIGRRQAASMRDVADVLIVGAGPAGATAALAALRARPAACVRLLDAAVFPRDKACGDGVAPHALAELAMLGVTDVTRGFGPVEWLDLRTPGGVRILTKPPRPNYVIPRRVLDERLVAAAVAAGAELVQHRARRVRVRPGVVEVDDLHAGRVLIAADGANSVVRRAIGLPRNPDHHLAVAVRGYAQEHEDVPRSQLIDMRDDAWPAYAWSFPLADGTGRANVGYGRLRSQLSSRSQLHGGLSRSLPDQPARDLRAHHLPLSSWRPRQPDGPVLLAGDAASLINPLTGEGIFYAVRSGRLAGEIAVAANGAAAGTEYRRALTRSLGQHLRHTAVLARLSGHRPALDAALVAASARQHLMDRLVDMGLGDGLIPAALPGLTVLSYVRRSLNR